MNKEQPKLRRGLGLIEVFCIASGAMISSGLFVKHGTGELSFRFVVKLEGG